MKFEFTDMHGDTSELKSPDHKSPAINLEGTPEELANEKLTKEKLALLAKLEKSTRENTKVTADETAAQDEKRLEQIRRELAMSVDTEVIGMFNDEEMELVNESIDTLSSKNPEAGEEMRAIETIKNVAQMLETKYPGEGESKFNIWAKGQGIDDEERQAISLGVFQLQDVMPPAKDVTGEELTADDIIDMDKAA